MLSQVFQNNFQTALNGAINAVVTTIVVQDAALFDGEFQILVDAELMRVTAGGTSLSWTVVRGTEGTTAATHSDAALVDMLITTETLDAMHKGNGVRVRNTANQNFANNFYGPVAFNVEDYDDEGYHDNVTNNSRLTIPRDGTFIIGSAITWELSAAGFFRYFDIGLNGGTFFPTFDQRKPDGQGGTPLTQVSAVKLVAGDFLEVNAQQDSGGTLFIFASHPDIWSPVFWLERVGK